MKVSWKTFVLEAWLVTFGKSLVENARVGSLDCPFWWKSRGKRSFWKLGLSLLVKVSWKTLVLEAWIVTFGESLVENVRCGSLDCHFWWKSRGKCLSGLQECQARVSSKSVKKECQAKSVQQECLARAECQAKVSSKSVKQECPARVSSKSVKKECSERVSSKSVQQECQARVSSKECPARVPSKNVQQECPARVSSKSVQHRVSSKSV